MDRLRLAICIGLAPETPTVSVQGTINIDGKPVPTGELHFGMLGVAPMVSKITDGTYSGVAPVGENQVEVYIYKEEPNPRYPETPIKTNTVPAKYWGPKTTLKATVKADGQNEFSFDITSQ